MNNPVCFGGCLRYLDCKHCPSYDACYDFTARFDSNMPPKCSCGKEMVLIDNDLGQARQTSWRCMKCDPLIPPWNDFRVVTKGREK